jgi:hypothetical protein
MWVSRTWKCPIWDSRCTVRRATPFAATGHVPDMRRATIIDIANEAVVGKDGANKRSHVGGSPRFAHVVAIIASLQTEWVH